MDEEYVTEEGLTGLTVEFTKKEALLDDSLTSNDWLDIFAPNPYDCCDAFPESTDNQENPSADRDIGTSIAINFSEIMEDLVHLMSLDKEVLDLHQGLHEPSTGKSPSHDLMNSGKRPFDEDVLDDDVLTSSTLPDHNYYSMHRKKQRVDDISAFQKTLTSEKQPEQQPQTVKNSKYFERRKKNNIASKRSRETRKNRFTDMEVQANQLEEENEKLRKRIEKLEELTQQMKEVLVKRLSTNNGR